MNVVLMTLLSLALLLACLVILRERRLRMALQQILKHILKQWRPKAYEQKDAGDCRHHHNGDGD